MRIPLQVALAVALLIAPALAPPVAALVGTMSGAGLLTAYEYDLGDPQPCGTVGTTLTGVDLKPSLNACMVDRVQA